MRTPALPGRADFIEAGRVLRGIYIPDDVLARISSALEHDQGHAQKDADAKHERLAQRLEAIRNRMSQAYADKLDGKIAEDSGSGR